MITFLIDTATPNTSISLTDAQVLGIDYDKLQDGSLLGGDQKTKIIPKCGICFFPNLQTGILEYFDQLAVQNVIPKSIEQHKLISQIPSILGHDLISRYRLVLQYPYMILEK